jgi:hypothetical protein
MNHPGPGHKPLSTRRTLDMLKINAAHLGRRNQAIASWTDGIERRVHFFEIDLPGAWHGAGVILVSRSTCAFLHRTYLCKK